MPLNKETKTNLSYRSGEMQSVHSTALKEEDCIISTSMYVNKLFFFFFSILNN